MSTGGLIFTALEVEQFRRFSGTCRLDGLGPGLNLLAAPNESGKSTMLAALRALFLYKFSSKTQAIKDLAPYDGGSPCIRADFTLDGVHYNAEKRFLGRNFARLSEDGRVLENDEAEARIQSLLGLDAARRGEADGLLGALWVEQGSSFAQPELCDTARESVQSCLAVDLDEITGGADAGRILKRVQDDLNELVNGHGKPKGRYAAALEGEEAVTGQIDILETRRRTLEQDLADLGMSRRLLERENDPVRQQAEQEELERAKAKKEQLLRFATREAQAQAAVQEADRELNRHRGTQAGRTERRARLAAVRKDYLTAVEERQQAETRLREADDALTRQSATLSTLEQKRTASAAAVTQAERHVERLRLKEERDAAHHRLSRLAALSEDAEKVRATLAACRVDEKRLKAVEMAEQALHKATVALDAQATRLDIALEPDAVSRVRLNGETVRDGRLSLVDPTELHIEGVGTFRIIPAISDRVAIQEAVSRARQAFRKALDEAGCADVAATHAEMGRRRQAEQDRRLADDRLKAALEGLPAEAATSPDKGIFHLRQRVADCDAQLAQFATDATETSPVAMDEARACLAEAKKTLLMAEQAVARTRDALRAPVAEQALAQKLFVARDTETQLHKQGIERLQAEEDATQAALPDVALDEQLRRAQDVLDQAERAKERLNADRPPESEALIEATISRLEEHVKGRQEKLVRLREDFARCQAAVRAAEGDGLDEAIAACQREIDRHCTEREACERDVAVLRLLKETLTAAERETTERYLAPLTRIVQPAIEMLFPRASATLDDRFSVSGLTRGRTQEDVQRLSDGTREQIAVLVRLGFADLLRAQGRPAMLVLDDALCFSDAMRMNTVFDILTDAARRMQIIVMTCRAEQFTGLSARPLRLETRIAAG
ncbi:AAA family ATPase [Acetobacter conturbans]|uniref:AAA family ATPase n=1 Tax=Acetobacter conturbans TaxID=1737472 RepID=A0ABX0K2U6_9PROT|nr:AAA family ATPase [Acetobacter conturbans]NHN88327.1 AAA family ATPase [Acetobacter conturbans]